jgi:hypothetical protein
LPSTVAKHLNSPVGQSELLLSFRADRGPTVSNQVIISEVAVNRKPHSGRGRPKNVSDVRNNFGRLLVSLRCRRPHRMMDRQRRLHSRPHLRSPGPFARVPPPRFAPTGSRFHGDGTSMLILVQTPPSPRPRSQPGPWTPSEIWLILLLPMLIVAFLGLVFVRSSRSQINGMRK